MVVTLGDVVALVAEPVAAWYMFASLTSTTSSLPRLLTSSRPVGRQAGSSGAGRPRRAGHGAGGMDGASTPARWSIIASVCSSNIRHIIVNALSGR